MDALKKVFQIEVKKDDIDEDESTLVAIVSSERRDRDGEIIRINENSVDLEGYRKNPVLLWQHRVDDPIGRAEKIGVQERKLIAKFKFHKMTQRSREIFQLYKTGFLNSFSISFLPKEKRDANKVYRKIEILEVSAVSVPSNIDAIIQNGYGQKITDNILRKDLNLEATETSPTPFLLDADILAASLKKAINPDAVKKIAQEGARFELERLKEKIITVEKSDPEIEVDLLMLKKIIPEQIAATFKGTDIKKLIEDKMRAQTKENMIVELGKLTGKVF